MNADSQAHRIEMQILSDAARKARATANQTAGRTRQSLRALADCMDSLIRAGAPCEECGAWHPQKIPHEDDVLLEHLDLAEDHDDEPARSHPQGRSKAEEPPTGGLTARGREETPN